ncbi:unnamed protein product [Trichogramma brassicae]|uniref:GST N-terminal domain-containing protein n=1 Tax=Trichogramma brassicae TaxID=86971 RepID=A0A6H5IQD3_9HYME|nr:unnamed protein product [Trichogramma brassicae]
MSLKLYHDLLSQPARALYIFLKQTGTPFESVFVNLMKGEHLKPGFAKLNAFKQIPIIEHDGFVLTESVAILRYLCREFKVDDHWYPKESKAQARVDEFLEWQHMGLRLHLVSYVRTKLVKREHDNAEFEKINVFKKVPAIAHDGFNVMESVAILRYLCREFKVADHWYPRGGLEGPGSRRRVPRVAALEREKAFGRLLDRQGHLADAYRPAIASRGIGTIDEGHGCLSGSN